MNIQHAIELLVALRTKHGGDIKVYFDCPTCKTSFSPDYVETVAMVQTKAPPGTIKAVTMTKGTRK